MREHKSDRNRDAASSENDLLGQFDRRSYLKGAAATLATGLGVGSLANSVAAQQTITSNQTGTYQGNFYSFWTDEEGSVEMTLRDGSYTLEWSNTNSTV